MHSVPPGEQYRTEERNDCRDSPEVGAGGLRRGSVVRRRHSVVVGDAESTAGLLPVLRTIKRSETPAVCVSDRPLGARGADETAVEAYQSLVSTGATSESEGIVETLDTVDRSSPSNPVRD